MQKEIWILLAANFELEQFKELVQEIKTSATLRPIVCGVGHHQPLYNLEQYFLQIGKPQGLLLLGTGGSFSCPAIGESFVARQFFLPPFLYEQYPDLIKQDFSFELLPQLQNKGYNEFSVFSSLGISISTNRFFAKEDLVENMEAYTIAFWAWQKKIPFNALLCTSNYIGKQGREQFQNNYQTCSQKLKLELKRIFS